MSRQSALLSAEGPLLKLQGTMADPVQYTAVVGESRLPLTQALGRGVEIRFLDRISCAGCAAPTRRSYGGGYCYQCFRTLARCDLCVVSPHRCHYHAGTCREPEWGDEHCMQPHLVYLANSSAPKVGITRLDNAVSRWIDQGASQGLVIMDVPSRRHAGLAEVCLAQLVGDRTDWRALVSREAQPVDLGVLRDDLRARVSGLPEGVVWREARPRSVRYPIVRYGHRAVALRLAERNTIRGNLLGIKGQYLLFDHGVFNVRHHAAYHVRLTLLPDPLEPGAGDDQQLELFS